jgi:putative lipoprotein
MNNLIQTAGWFAALFLALPFAVFAQNAPAQDAAGVVTGTAAYRERIAMPKDAAFEATPEDVSKRDPPAEAIGKALMENRGNPPYHCSISHDPRQIVDHPTYAVRATIKIEDRLAFASDISYPVIPRGNGKEPDILLKSASRRAAPVASGKSPGDAALENTNWNLTRVGDKDVAGSDSQRTPYIFLDPAGNHVSGSGGCNRLSGTYHLDKQTIRFGPTGLTMMACPQGMDLEKDFMEALGETRRWKIRGNELEFYDQDGKLLVRFEAGKAK